MGPQSTKVWSLRCLVAGVAAKLREQSCLCCQPGLLSLCSLKLNPFPDRILSSFPTRAIILRLGFSTWALLVSWAGTFVVGPVLCIVECLAAALASTHQMPVAPHVPSPSCDNEKCPQLLSDVPWGAESPPIVNSCSEGYWLLCTVLCDHSHFSGRGLLYCNLVFKIGDLVNIRCVCAELLQSCLTLCDPMDCSPPGSSARGILQARILGFVAMPCSMGSSCCRDRTWVSYISCISRPVL